MAGAPLLAPWADLPGDALDEIICRLPCPADRDRLTEVCRAWREALARRPPPPPIEKLRRSMPLPPPAPLPWLLLPGAGAEPTLVCCIIDGCSDRHRLHAAHGGRLFGSYDGGWVFVAFGQTQGHAIVNLRNRCPEKSRLDVPDMLAHCGHYKPEKIIIHAATLSAAPNLSQCIGAAIVSTWRLSSGRRQIMFWRMGDEIAVDAMPSIAPHPSLEPEDVIPYRGVFHILTSGEHTRICAPVFKEGDGVKLSSDFVCWFNKREQEVGEHVIARYLVESRGLLLMVVRLGKGPEAPTTTFKVFESIQEHMTPDGSKIRYVWSPLEALDGRILVLGRGCSKSYELDQYLALGFEEGIFFEDGWSFQNDAMPFRGVNQRRYSCVDNGLWSADEIVRCFPHQRASNHSPPCWLLP